ncbi:Putative zinc-or iron-chelating domain-containing protein [Trichlorobacter thiogenes]|uniref:Putative zinc-or iron-chelating domain-containing protein n=1 Tax=Trichlorobacter thiogenes TaxID=115783 RepID=A0A1T4L7T8_9BACT|nr:YkgJ family cysteine cluster protein [Trichlorobacter thiogenes]SJZ50581.1 Putative zinc-or iron-chelating domain-containing protein [Trichlorobacter thiogenes]
MKELLDSVQERQDCFDHLITAWSSEYRQRGGSIHCGKGCSGCCSLVVNCTFPEALLVAAALDKEQHERLKAQIAGIKHAADSSASLKEWLHAYRFKAGPCPFLDQTGACGVYASRPLSCRSLLATKEPAWCVTDFASLDSNEKQAFMESLDRSAVAFPTHYAATPQEIGQELEEATLKQMETVYVFSLLGSLPWLVWLELEHQLSRRLADGPDAVQEYLTAEGLANPFLIVLG